MNPNYQITKFESEEIVSINVYRSAQGNTQEIVSILKEWQEKDKGNIITGDVNICARKDRNSVFIRTLTEEGYKLHTKEEIHIQGGHIDHSYTRNVKANIYYSYHDGICITVEKVKSVIKSNIV